jgi:hypothetical protein
MEKVWGNARRAADLARFHCRLAVGPRRADLEFMGGVADGRAAGPGAQHRGLDGAVSSSKIAVRAATRLR